MSEQLDSIKSSLIACAMSRMSDLEHTDASELGEVIDMIKDLEEAKYYCEITKAMGNSKKEQADSDKIEKLVLMNQLKSQNEQNYYGSLNNSRMYYDGNNSNGSSARSYSSSRYYPLAERDYREGRSYATRRGYMEGKEQHRDKVYQMQELETYIRELGEDVSEMIHDASPEEKKLLHDKLELLAKKIV